MSDAPAPLEPPTSPLPGTIVTPHHRIVAILEILLCSSLPTQIAIGYLLQLSGWAPTTASGALSLAYVLTLSLADTLVLIILMVALLHAHGERATELWVGHRRVRREALIGLAMIPLAFLFVVILLNGLRLLFPWLHNVETNPLEALAGNS